MSAITRTNASGPSPSIADLVGDNLHLELGPTAQVTPPRPVGTFLIPSTDLASVDVDIDLLGPNPWGRVMNLAGTPSSPVLGDPPVLPPLTSQPSPHSGLRGARYDGEVSGWLGSRGSRILHHCESTFHGYWVSDHGQRHCGRALPASATPLSLLNLRSGPNPVLILIQNVLPYVATFTVPVTLSGTRPCPRSLFTTARLEYVLRRLGLGRRTECARARQWTRCGC